MDSVNMLVSGIINREGKRFARVSFIRGRDIAEGIVPDGVVDHAEGFSEAEVAKLEGVSRSVVTLLTQKLVVDIEDGKAGTLTKAVKKIVKKYEPDVTVIEK